MTFDEYQKTSERTLKKRQVTIEGHDIPTEEGADLSTEALVLGALGLAGEAGEAIEHVKKHVFHGHALDREALMKEIGDVLWYLAALATGADLNLGQCAIANVEKLAKRYPEGFTRAASIARADEHADGRSNAWADRSRDALAKG
jgi:NTP pyrophosphatase (non-canonical NTP hydrolase)